MSERPHQGRAGPARDRSFLARYGAIILRGGIASIPTALYRYQGELDLTPQQVWFISAILAHKWDAELPYPSLKRLAEHTGVSRQKLHDYQRQLIAAGHLIVINRRTPSGGQDTNYFDFSPLLHRLEEFLERDRPSRDPWEASRGGPGDDAASGDAGDGRWTDRRGVNRDLQPPVNPSRQTRVNGGRQPAVNPGLHEEEPLEETGDLEKSNEEPRDPFRRLAARNRMRTAANPDEGAAALHGDILPRDGNISVDAEERESLDLYVEDLARELGDRAPLRSSGGRLLNLYRRSGLDMDTFVERVQTARRTTKERLPQIRGERKPGRPKAAMSYFFAVLEDLLEPRARNGG